MFDELIGNITRGVFTVGFEIDRHSPELLIIGGLVAGAAAIYTTVTATLKVHEVLDKVEEDKALVEKTREEHPEAYTEEAYTHDLKVIRKDATVGMIKLYYKPALFFLLSTVCYFAAHKILHDREVAIAAALKVTQEAFDRYRARVREKEGDDADRYYRYGALPPARDESGAVAIPENTEETSMALVDPNSYSQYARLFDVGNSNWSNVPEFNLMYLKTQQNLANDMLHSRGHVFLNEVYRLLGFPDTKAGSVVGWILGKGHDNFVDFGFQGVGNEAARDFANGYSPSVWLDFNVDGVIYDKI